MHGGAAGGPPAAGAEVDRNAELLAALRALLPDEHALRDLKRASAAYMRGKGTAADAAA
eukprot:gene40071-11086_t